MAIERRLLFFAGSGTDSTGYTRVAQAIVDGWYFKDVPAPTDEDRLYRPARVWTRLMKKLDDRPGTYGLVAITSRFTWNQNA
jgi:hypothetical protein